MIKKILATSDINELSLEITKGVLSVDVPGFLDNICKTTIFPNIENNLDRVLVEIMLTVDFMVHINQYRSFGYEEALVKGMLSSVNTLLNLPMEEKDSKNWLLEITNSNLSLDSIEAYISEKCKQHIDTGVLQLNNMGCIPLTWHDDALVVLIHESIPSMVEHVLENMPSSVLSLGGAIDDEYLEEDFDELFDREF